MNLKIQCHYPDMPLPAKAHPGDAGLDLTAMAVEAVRPGVFRVDTGVSLQPEPGFYCEVAPRSSIFKTDFMMANSIGIIDADYRGRVYVMLRYLGAAADGGAAEAQSLVGQRVAQLLVRRVEQVRAEAVDTLEESRRGAGGFGSTGR